MIAAPALPVAPILPDALVVTMVSALLDALALPVAPALLAALFSKVFLPRIFLESEDLWSSPLYALALPMQNNGK